MDKKQIKKLFKLLDRYKKADDKKANAWYKYAKHVFKDQYSLPTDYKCETLLEVVSDLNSELAEELSYYLYEINETNQNKVVLTTDDEKIRGKDFKNWVVRTYGG